MRSKKKQHPALWGFTTYFAEGLPYTIIRQISSLFLRDRGVALGSIGLTSLFGLPWILKFLWAPLLDHYGTKRHWMILVQSVLTLIFAVTAFISPLPTAPVIIAILFFVASFFASTNDTAIDGYYLEALDSDEQANYVGYRVMAYRIAMIFGTGVVGTIGPRFGWFPAFATAAVAFGAVTLFHALYLYEPQKAREPLLAIWKPLLKPRVTLQILAISLPIILVYAGYKSDGYGEIKELYPLLKKVYFSHIIAILLLVVLFALFLLRGKITRKLEASGDSFYAKAYLTYIDRPKIVTIFAAIIFIRTGEFMLSSMVAPFFVDLGIKVHYGWISGTVGLSLSIAGALVGGAMIKKFTLKRVLWPFLLLQNLTNLVYMVLAFVLSEWIVINAGAKTTQFIGTGNLALVAVVQGFDQFAGGLGTAVLTLLLMRLCIGEFKAAHYAIGTAFMSVSGVIAGIFGGLFAEAYGYSWLFGASFLFSIPGMIAVMLLPKELVEDRSLKIK
jgi:PAT family beta-lactamase induction signal transducer AmpG